MTSPRPVALGYVAARTAVEIERQRREVASYAETEGLALADTFDDIRDGLTISQVTEAARNRGANVVMIPAEARLADAYTRLAYELERHGRSCVLLGDSHPTTHQESVPANPRRRS